MILRKSAPLFVALGLVCGAGCGDDDGSGGAGGSTTGGGGAGGTPATGGSGGQQVGGQGGQGGLVNCDTAPLTPVAEDAFLFNGTFGYIAQSSLGAPVDTLNFELVGGTPAVGDLVITDADYATCTNCVLLYLGCDQNLANCQQTFLAQSGTISVTSSGASGADFRGTLQGASFVEVELNGMESTIVPGGASFCWADYTFNAVIQ
ncbi:MAG: hypothetical protein U0271_13450 [Polyangiaceae bacterium]